MRQGCFDDPKGCVDISFNCRVEILISNIKDQIVRLLATCIAHDYVENAEFRYCIRHKPSTKLLLANISRKRDAKAASFAY